MILIVSNKNDGHSDLIAKKLNERNETFLRLNTEDFPQKVKISLSKQFDSSSISIETPFGKFGGEDVTSVWYRRPEKCIIDPSIEDKPIRGLAEKESQMTLRWLWELLEKKLWVNHPIYNRVARNKLLQYKISEELGITHPDYIITNNPDEARQFIASYPSVAVKPISGDPIERKDGYRTIYTNKISKQEIKDIDSVKLAPTFFQEYIPKSFELRITAIDEEVLACKINSQESQKTKDDWRRYDFGNVEHEKFNLPSRIKEFCVDMTKSFNLKFGAIDMIVTPENKYVFLEINANGQWNWIENLTGLPISEKLIELLLNKQTHS